MASDKLRAACAALLLAASAAGSVGSLDAPRLLVGCVLAGLIAAAWGWAASPTGPRRRLPTRRPHPSPTSTPRWSMRRWRSGASPPARRRWR